MRDGPVFRRRHLPHWDIPGAIYFITTCLQGSIPAEGLLDLARYQKELDARHRPAEIPADEWQRRLDKLHFALADEWLDLRAAVRHLEDPRLAAEVHSALRHFANERYDVFAYVVMPSHMHWVMRPREEWIAAHPEITDRTAREVIMHSVKRHSALKCNELLGFVGTFWQAESYDHCIRDLDELLRCIAYVENNPVKAGLVKSAAEWKYSS
ncbi:MAG TPA: hypothetical protein VHR66_24090, partial [Gemmataceae bacterium]|nr:hypothetical protein [Gemmataceae bacterium]